jgi:hypothetical protein
MKKQILLFSISSLFVAASIAQVDKKDILLGATVAVNSNDNSIQSTNSNSNLRTRIGYAIGRNSVLNITFGYSFNKAEGSGYTYKSNIFSTGVSWQKFFVIKDKVGWYTDLYAMYNNGTSKHLFPAGESKVRSQGYSIGVNPGIYYKPVNSLLLTVNAGGISYDYFKNSTSGQPVGRESNFTVNVFDYFGFGIGFIISKKAG